MSIYRFSVYGTPKFHIGEEMRILSPDLNSSIAATTAFHASSSSGVYGLPCMSLYLAATSRPPNSGSDRLQTSTVFTVSAGWAAR